jgi:hypothetical protein
MQPMDKPTPRIDAIQDMLDSKTHFDFFFTIKDHPDFKTGGQWSFQMPGKGLHNVFLLVNAENDTYKAMIDITHGIADIDKQHNATLNFFSLFPKP